MTNIKASLPNYFSRVEGIDWSPSTVEYHKNNNFEPYNNVALCKSDRLPYEDREFDICLSMENLEHLYGQVSIDALREMQRVSRHVIITTPSPEHVVNFDFLHQEIKEAVDDLLPLTYREFICLESAVHKSVLLPKSMIKAGFRQFGSPSHSFFWAKSDDISLDNVRCVGIRERNSAPRIANANNETDYRKDYIVLLADSIGLDAQIKPYKTYGLRAMTYRLRAILNSAYLRLLHSAKSYLLLQNPSLFNRLKKICNQK